MEKGCVMVRDETAKAGGSEHLAELFRLDPGSPQESWKDKRGTWKDSATSMIRSEERFFRC